MIWRRNDDDAIEARRAPGGRVVAAVWKFGGTRLDAERTWRTAVYWPLQLAAGAEGLVTVRYLRPQRSKADAIAFVDEQLRLGLMRIGRIEVLP